MAVWQIQHTAKVYRTSPEIKTDPAVLLGSSFCQHSLSTMQSHSDVCQSKTRSPAAVAEKSRDARYCLEI